MKKNWLKKKNPKTQKKIANGYQGSSEIHEALHRTYPHQEVRWQTRKKNFHSIQSFDFSLKYLSGVCSFS